MKKVVVIGGGPAGIRFSRQIKVALKDKVDVTMFMPEKNSAIYCAIPYAIEGLIEPEKVAKSDSLVTEVGVNLHHKKVTSVDFGNRKVYDDEGKAYEYDELFIATGSINFVPPIEGVDLANVMTVKFIEDMEKILERIENGAKKAVVVGAGAIGNELATAFVRRGLETYLVEMKDRVLPNMVDSDFADDLNEEHIKNGVKLLLEAKLERLEGNKWAEKVYIRLKDGSEKVIELSEVDFVVFAVGVRANVELFKDSPLMIGRDGIIVDSRMRTNLPGVWAAGDVCQYYSLIDGAPLGGKLATNAVPMAKVAAFNFLGVHEITYKGFLNAAASVVYETRVAAVGFTEEVAKMRGYDPVSAVGEGHTKFPIMPGVQKVKVKLIADRNTKRIIGAQFKGPYAIAEWNNTMSVFIQNKGTIYDVFDFNYTAQPHQSDFPGVGWLSDTAAQLIKKLRAK